MNNKMVNISNIEKSLIKISFDVISELSIKKNIKTVERAPNITSDFDILSFFVEQPNGFMLFIRN